MKTNAEYFLKCNEAIFGRFKTFVITMRHLATERRVSSLSSIHGRTSVQNRPPCKSRGSAAICAARTIAASALSRGALQRKLPTLRQAAERGGLRRPRARIAMPEFGLGFFGTLDWDG